jgi:hypothetical protein
VLQTCEALSASASSALLLSRWPKRVPRSATHQKGSLHLCFIAFSLDLATTTLDLPRRFTIKESLRYTLMSLFQATLFTGILLIAFGAHFLWHGMASEKGAKAFPRSTTAAYLLMGTATAWFLYKVMHLGPADFGQYKNILFLVFLTVGVGSFYFVPDFLAVRGLAALTLLTAGALLDASYMQFGPALFLKTLVYICIVAALILGASPYKLRNFFEWLYKSELRPKLFGGIFAAYGLLLTGVAFIY